MLRYDVKVTVAEKEEETNRRIFDFPSTQDDVDHIRLEIYRVLNGVHLVDGDGRVFVLSIANIREI